jgi:hypothetical protein
MTLPRSGSRSDAKVALWPSHGTAAITMSARPATSPFAKPVKSHAPVAAPSAPLWPSPVPPLSSSMSSPAACRARSASRDPISTRWPAEASR